MKIGDIYSDLGLDNAIPAKDTAVYEDGQASQSTTNSVKWDNYDIARGQKAKIGGNGALTEVFYDADDDSVVITVVNTYVGKVDRVMSASSTRDPYVVISDPGSVATAPAANLTFETEAFDEDDVVLYTYSYDTKEVESLDAAEMVTGTVTEAQNKQTDSRDSQNVTLDGAKYSAARKFGGDEVGDVTVDNEYNLYLDNYGYMIMLEQVEDLSSDYALVLATEGATSNNSSTIGGENRARLVFADGTVKTVDTVKNYNKAGSDHIANGTIVTYRVEEDNEYTLRAVKHATGFTSMVVTSASFNMVNGRAWIERNNSSALDVYANSGTAFVIYNDGSDEWEAYTGIKNAPSVTGEVTSYTYVKNGMTKIMFIVPDDYSAQVVNSGNKNLFLVKDSASNLISDGDSQYYNYNAIVDGDIVTIKVDESEGKNLDGFYSNYNIDKYGVYDNLTKLTGGTNPAYFYENGVSKTSLEYTVSFDYDTTNKVFKNTYTVADDADIYYVDEDDVIEASSYGAIGRDFNDKVSVIVKDNQITTLVIEYVDDDTVAPPVTGLVNEYTPGWGITVNGVVIEQAPVYYKNTGTNTDTLNAALANAQPLSLSSIASLTDGSSYTFKAASAGSKMIGVYTSTAAVTGFPTTSLGTSGQTVSLQVGQVVVISEANSAGTQYCAAYVIVA